MMLSIKSRVRVICFFPTQTDLTNYYNDLFLTYIYVGRMAGSPFRELDMPGKALHKCPRTHINKFKFSAKDKHNKQRPNVVHFC